jgi:O-antigen ligase
VGLRNWWYADTLHKILGVGPDCFWFHAAENEELSLAIWRAFGESRLTNAHCEILTILVNTGIVGVAAFLFLVISFFRVFAPKLKENPKYLMFVLPMVMYLSNNMISFQQLMNTPLLFALMGTGASALVKER